MIRLLVASVVVLAPAWAAGIGPTKPSVIITRFDDPTPPPQDCLVIRADDPPPNCSLRSAIAVVENTPSVDRTISLPPGVYQLQQGSITLAGELKLVGGGAGTTSIDALTKSRAFVVAPSATIAMTGLTILHGNATGDGGAIVDQGTLTLTDCALRNNASGSNGGAVSSKGTLNLVRTVVADNTATAAGGGIVNDHGSLTVVDSTIERNTSNDLNTDGFSAGGGLGNFGTATLTGCTISDNAAAESFGGGISTALPGTMLTLVNCTLSGNQTPHAGGGLFVGSNGVATLDNVTVTANTGFAGVDVATTGALIARNSIIAGNALFQCGGTIQSRGFNLIGDSNCTIADSSHDLVGVDPLLGPLDDNGGPTRTHALLPGSPALDAGNPATPGSSADACAAADQRGVTRPQPAGGRCDVGAFEVEVASPTTTTTSTLPPVEICGDCIDNDGNGLTDMEDPACCPTPSTLTIRASRLAPAHQGAKLALGGTLGVPALPSATQDVFVQMRADGQPDFLCARIPAADLTRKKTRESFKDGQHAVATADGVDAAVLRQTKHGSVVLKVGGRRLAVSLPPPGMLDVTVGFRDPAAGESGNQCVKAGASFKAGRKGALQFP